jgi:ASC-1-like (ASCH) protein
VEEKRTYSTFAEMLRSEGLEKCLPGIFSIEDGVAIYRQFYSKEEEAQFGVLAFKVIVFKSRSFTL